MLSTTTTGLRRSRLPVFSAIMSMKPNLSSNFMSWETDLKSLFRIFANS